MTASGDDRERARQADSSSAGVPERGGVPGDERRAAIVERLRREGARFDYERAAWLAEQLATAPSAVRCRAGTSLVFPAGDVRRVEVDHGADGVRTRITAAFMGLYGVDGALPGAYVERLAARPDAHRALRTFLDAFDRRFYHFYYRASLRAHPALQAPSAQRQHARRVCALAGIAPDVEVEGRAAGRLLALAGRFVGRARNAEGLEALLRHVVGEAGVRVEEHVARRVPIRRRAVVGGARRRLHLGKGATVGAAVYDRTGCFRVHLGPLGVEAYRALQPGGTLAERVRRAVRWYAPDDLDYDVRLVLDASTLPASTLGGQRPRLGRTAFAGHPVRVSRDVRYVTPSRLGGDGRGAPASPTFAPGKSREPLFDHAYQTPASE